MNPEVTEAAAPGLLNLFCYSMLYVPDLTEEDLPERAADDLLDQASFQQTVHEFYPVFAETVAAGEVPAEAVEMAGIHSPAQILDFLGKLLIELDRRKPWPAPPLARLDPEQWPTAGASRAIAWVEARQYLMEAALKATFDDVPAGEMPMLVLRTRTGQVIGVIGDPDPTSDRYVIVVPDDESAMVDSDRDIREYLADFAGLELETEGID